MCPRAFFYGCSEASWRQYGSEPHWLKTKDWMVVITELWDVAGTGLGLIRLNLQTSIAQLDSQTGTVGHAIESPPGPNHCFNPPCW